MIDKSLKPWANLKMDSKLRVNKDLKYNLFWVKDSTLRYGLLFQTSMDIVNNLIKFNFKEFDVIHFNENGNGFIYLLLKDKSNDDLFYKLCIDLIESVVSVGSEQAALIVFENRLLRWQRIFLRDTFSQLTIIQQMGLFAELYVLKNHVLKNNSLPKGLKSWVGPEFDKQDFVLNGSLIEVKSYKTSKGPSVIISSAEQLYSENNEIFLVTIGLSPSEHGDSILDLVLCLKELIGHDNIALKNLLDDKLLDFGLCLELASEELETFIVDSERIYKVIEKFPRITPENLGAGIKKVSYELDLTKCSSFETSMKEVFN